ncbi:MAG: transposase [Planctomycetes bacterium]|nr:transposase [Planctomycetota bacterium]
MPKSAFTWLPEERAYRCPQGHRLEFTKTQTQPRADHKITLSSYTCPPEHCQTCPRLSECTRTPKKGRTVSRMENEELLDDLEQRMQMPEARELYKQRSRTIELNLADLKEHRGLRQFHFRTLNRATAEVGSPVLTHNIHHVEAHRRQPNRNPRDEEIPQSLSPSSKMRRSVNGAKRNRPPSRMAEPQHLFWTGH